ncbi:Type 1 glutamine amidotransferase-like domain-containing protein [Enterococcus faecalis]
MLADLSIPVSCLILLLANFLVMKGKLYIGESAGAVVLSKTIEYIKYQKDG